MRRFVSCALALAAAAAFSAPVSASREPVLRQIDVPHNYYWREMYIPQLTSGPSSLAWSPDGKSLVFSMRGGLWRQDIGSDTAIQLTAGPGYDYQPDWSPDGRRIVFARYHGDAIELWVLDLTSGQTRQLTHTGAVNLEPRWSPSGDRIAFVSTLATKRFRIFTAAMTGEFSPVQFSPERRSKIDRYYYSPYDHELSPSWSPDGKELLYVSNPEIAYGTGSIWRRAVSGGEPRLVREEETSWRARPDWARDGKRVVWSSYSGRQWNQLWIANAAGGPPLPLTFGDFDATAPRWSPDGRHIAYVSNESGDGRIVIMDLPGGAKHAVAQAMRKWLRPMGELALTIRDEHGSSVPARISVTGSDGRAYAPDDAWIRADDNFDRADQGEETHYFHAMGNAALTLPAGAATIRVWHGLQHSVETRTVIIAANGKVAAEIDLRPQAPAGFAGWQSADVHVHMNYGGTYRNTPERMVAQAEAEDLDVVFSTIVNKEQRFPDIAYYSPVPDPASKPDMVLVPAQEYHTSYWGHLGLLGLKDHFLLPGFAAYPGTGLASLYPDNVAIAELAHRQGALVGYVHPFDPPGEPNTYSTNAEAVNAPLGLIDYYETVGFADFRTSVAIWYRLLNLGFHIAAAGGTDDMANYASLRGPVGLNRTYVIPQGPQTTLAERRDAWLAGLRAGHSFATNGPLLTFTLDGHEPGETIELPAGGGTLDWRGAMTSIFAVDHVEVVQNGKVLASLKLGKDGKAAAGSGRIPVGASGWVLLRAWSAKDQPDLLDLYPYATTTPVYVNVADKPARSPTDAKYMLDWLDLIEKSARASQDYNTPEERQTVLDHIARARAAYEKML